MDYSVEVLRNPFYANADGTAIDLQIEHPELGWSDFTASKNDPEFHSRWLFKLAEKGQVGSYVPPAPPPVSVPAGILWARTTEEEAEQLDAAMTAKPVKVRKLYADASVFVEGDGVWPHLMAATQDLFGEGRAAELLAAI